MVICGAVFILHILCCWLPLLYNIRNAHFVLFYGCVSGSELILKKYNTDYEVFSCIFEKIFGGFGGSL